MKLPAMPMPHKRIRIDMQSNHKLILSANLPFFIELLTLPGITWYCQFMFYGMGTTKMGKYDFASWSIHMAFIIVFSNLWGLILHEWKGSSHKTIQRVIIGIMVLILSTFVIGAGNYIATFER
jgi:hypothetical protein